MENYINSARKFMTEVRIANVAVDHLNLPYTRYILQPSPIVKGVVLAECPDASTGGYDLFHQV
jgi:hypothetical protein